MKFDILLMNVLINFLMIKLFDLIFLILNLKSFLLRFFDIYHNYDIYLLNIHLMFFSLKNNSYHKTLSNEYIELKNQY